MGELYRLPNWGPAGSIGETGHYASVEIPALPADNLAGKQPSKSLPDVNRVLNADLSEGEEGFGIKIGYNYPYCPNRG